MPAEPASFIMSTQQLICKTARGENDEIESEGYGMWELKEPTGRVRRESGGTSEQPRLSRPQPDVYPDDSVEETDR